MVLQRLKYKSPNAKLLKDAKEVYETLMLKRNEMEKTFQAHPQLFNQNQDVADLRTKLIDATKEAQYYYEQAQEGFEHVVDMDIEAYNEALELVAILKRNIESGAYNEHDEYR